MSQKDVKKILLLAGHGSSTNIVFHALSKEFKTVHAILEQKEKTSVFLKRRIKKLGYLEVGGQILFQLIIVPVLNVFSSRHQTILKSQGMDAHDIPATDKTEVLSINDSVVADLLAEITPDVVVVNGTRIISKRILSKINCPIINMHAGITPMYRGVHGGYWALVNKDEAHCGVTVHLVDAGVDTGDVIDQALIQVDNKDNFLTYPIKQLQVGIPVLIKSINQVFEGTLQTRPVEGNSMQWYHPTIWLYLYNLIFKGVK